MGNPGESIPELSEPEESDPSLPDHLGYAALQAARESPEDTLWQALETRQPGLFREVRAQFEFIRESFDVKDGGNWQAFFCESGQQDVSARTWVVGRTNTLHLVANREHSDPAAHQQSLHYGEYVVAKDRQQMGSRHGVAVRGSNQPWTPVNLAGCVLLRHCGKKVEYVPATAKPLALRYERRGPAGLVHTEEVNHDLVALRAILRLLPSSRDHIPEAGGTLY
jgi:hypothetical protein